MNLFFGAPLIGIFISLALIHLYWVFGGTKGLDKALPTDKTGKRILNPGKVETLIVGIGLLLFAFFYILKTGIIEIQVPSFLLRYGGWGISAIFILRAIGDFKYVGFFKKIKHTEFGIFDTKYFSLLSLLIGLLGLTLESI